MPESPSRIYAIDRVSSGQIKRDVPDELAVEEPLEIRIASRPHLSRRVATISLTIRTRGHDHELVAGFLFTEGIVSRAEDLRGITTVGIDWLPGETANAVQVELASDVPLDLQQLERHFYTSSSCGVCGKTSIDAVRAVSARARIESDLSVAREIITSLPDKLRAAQATFNRTGGLHASALFNQDGELLLLREDVGRHNALDKLIGARLLAAQVPISDSILLVSGRASFELMQKAVMAGIPILAAVGAPSSLAVDLAAEFGFTLIGFVRGDRFNIYSDSSLRISL